MADPCILLRLVIVLAAALLVAGWDFSRFVARADRAVTPDPPINAEAVDRPHRRRRRPHHHRHPARRFARPAAADLRRAISTPRRPTSRDITDVDVTEIECCVTLGKAAATTEGNGAEVADWARRNKGGRIIVVTSEYHMDRALLELQRAMPEGHFIPHAVMTTKVRPADWYRDPATASRLLEEWMKFRLAALRPVPPRPNR